MQFSTIIVYRGRSWQLCYSVALDLGYVYRCTRLCRQIKFYEVTQFNIKEKLVHSGHLGDK